MSMVKPGESRTTKLSGSLDGIRFTTGRMVEMIQESRKDSLVIATARKIAALSLCGRKFQGIRNREWWMLKGIHAWCRANFQYVPDPVHVELIQTPNRMLRELQIPPQLHMLMWKPIGKALGGQLPKPKMTGDSDEATVLSLSLAAAVGIDNLIIRLGGHDGVITNAWGQVFTGIDGLEIDILSSKFNQHPKFDVLENVDVPLHG